MHLLRDHSFPFVLMSKALPKGTVKWTCEEFLPTGCSQGKNIGDQDISIDLLRAPEDS